MGRAFRYVRRIAHIEIELAERTRGKAGLATVVGEEPSASGAKPQAKARGNAKVKRRAASAKTKSAKRQNEKKFAGTK
jgi:large subunit ribosomal protein L22